MLGCLAIIPARLGSQRLPEKALAKIAGVPLVVHALRIAAASPAVDAVRCATPDVRIAEVVRDFGFEAVLTGPASNGTARVLDVAARLPARMVLNVQGDLVKLGVSALAALRARLEAGERVATLACAWPEELDPAASQHVKVRVDASGRAQSFSRAPIWPAGVDRLHVGVYGFAADVLDPLRRVMALPGAPREDLEQLAWMDAGIDVGVALTLGATLSVDTADDLARARACFA